MKSYRASSGPFDKRLHFSPSEIDTMCRDALAKAKLLPSEPEAIRIDRFVEKHFNCEIAYDDLGAGVLGCTVFNGNGSIKVVIISSLIEDGSPGAERRLRSTIAHEGGHCLMHPSLFMDSLDQGKLGFTATQRENIYFKERRILCRDNDVKEGVTQRGHDGRWWEWQANRAIGGLLLPTDLVKKSVATYLQYSTVTGSPDLPFAVRREAEVSVANIFGVNPVVAKIRLTELFPEASGQMSF